MATDRKTLKQLFQDDPDVLRVLELREQTGLLKGISEAKPYEISPLEISKNIELREQTQYLREIAAHKELLKGDPGEKGDTGDVPTDEHLVSLIGPLIPALIPSPKKGEKGDMPTVDYERIFDFVKEKIAKIPVPKGSDGKSVSVADVVKELKKKQHLEPKDIKGLPVNMNDMRWHGSGGATSSSISALIVTDIFTTTDGQTAFTASNNVLATLLLTISGAFQTPTTDYTVSSSVATLTPETWPNGVPAGEPVVWVYIKN